MMRVLETAGHQMVSAINEAHVIAGRERRAATPASAQAFIDTLHGLFKWAVSVRLTASDPTLNVKVKTRSKRKGGYPPWTDEDMAKFEARWPRGTRERVIFDILAYTGLRIGDVAILGRQHLKQRTIVIDGRPWTKGALGTEFVAAAQAAGVFGKSAHGVRKGAATRAAKNGATERELEAIFGWSGGGWRPSTPKARTGPGLRRGP
jgi:integrase